MGSTSVAKWKPPSNMYIVMNYKYCKVWIRKADKIQYMQEYKLEIFNQRQLELYQNMFFYRMEQSYFPRSMYFLIADDSYLCNSSRSGSILIQRIPYRLCQFTNIPYNEAISALYFCLKGYHQLYKVHGLFNVKSTMIGLDIQYKFKIWHHTDFSNHSPQDPYCHTIIEMIKSIIRSIQRVANFPFRLPRFTQYIQLNRNQLYSFQLALNTVQQYAKTYKMRLSNSFQEIEKYLKEAEGLFPFSTNNFSLKSSQRSQKRSLSKNRSQGKYSFKTNMIIEDSDRKFNTFNKPLQSIYFNNKQQRNQSYRSVQNSRDSSIQSVRQSQNEPHGPLKLRLAQINNSSLASFNSHQLKSPPIQKSSPRFTQTRTSSNRQKASKQPNLVEPSSHRYFGHGRIPVNTPHNKMLSFRPVKAFNQDQPSTKAQTKEDQISMSKSFKSLLSAQSVSFTVDQDFQNNMFSIIRNR